MRVIRWGLALAAAAALLTGCGGDGDTAPDTVAQPPPGSTRFEFGLGGLGHPQNAGILLAGRLGYFAEAGYNINPRKPVQPGRPIPYVVNGGVYITISQAPEVVLARAQGQPVVAVASLIPQPTAAMIWLEKSKVDDIVDLRGKTIAIPGVPFQKELLAAILARAGLALADVKVKEVGYELTSALVSGRADAIFGGTWNVEGTQLEARGLEPVVTRVEDLGVPAYDEVVLVVRRDRLTDDPQMVRDLVAAAFRGTAAAIEDPEAAYDAVGDEGAEMEEKLVEAAVEETLPLFSETGRVDPERMESLVDWMHEEGLIQRKPPVSELMTNDYLK